MRVRLLIVSRTRCQSMRNSGASRGMRRCIQDDHSGAFVNRLANTVPVDGEVGVGEAYVPRDTAVQADSGFVGIIGWIEDNHLVTGVDRGGQGAVNGLRGARGHDDLALGVSQTAVQRIHFGRDLFFQTGHPGQGCVLIVSQTKVPGNCLAQCGRAVKIRKALGQVYGAVVLRHFRHDGENCRAGSR